MQKTFSTPFTKYSAYNTKITLCRLKIGKKSTFMGQPPFTVLLKIDNFTQELGNAIINYNAKMSIIKYMQNTHQNIFVRWFLCSADLKTHIQTSFCQNPKILVPLCVFVCICFSKREEITCCFLPFLPITLYIYIAYRP